MKRKGLSLLVIYLFLLTVFSTFFVSDDLSNVESIDPYFTLVAKVDENNPRYLDYMNLVKQQLARAGIKLEILHCVPYLSSSIYDKTDFDICYFEYENENSLVDPDFSDLYSENGSFNVFGYESSIDYNNTLEIGMNEYYLNQGKQLFPPNSPKRILNYKMWEDNLVDHITPGLPAFSPNIFSLTWQGLEGYNISKGLIQSFGNLVWTSAHIEQQNQEEIVISDEAWMTLNPLFQTDEASRFISDAILDPLVWFDSDSSFWPHLATNISIINDKQIRILSREGIKWQIDPDGTFTNEYFDIDDVYFSLYAWKHLSNKQSNYQWIDRMEKIDEKTIDVFIEYNPDTPDREPHFKFLESLAISILPEHYLNQTQIVDGITPDILHPSWTTFSQQCFGTGMFNLTSFTEGIETNLSLSNRYWGFDDSIINDEKLNYLNRFGDFAGSINHLRVKINPNDIMTLNEFQNGKIDLVKDLDYSQMKEVDFIDQFILHKKPSNKLGMFGFNLRPSRPTIGNPDSSPGDPSLTVGQALRRAICYAIDLNEINEVVHSGNYFINKHHLPANLKIWWYQFYRHDNSNTDYYYNHDLDLAREYMNIAGYEYPQHTYGFDDRLFFIDFLLIFVIFILPLLILLTVIFLLGYFSFRGLNGSEEPTNFTKKLKFNCYYCNKSIKRDISICPNCNKTIPHCIVCSLPIAQKSIIGKCVHCDKVAHLTHLQEWLKVKGYCPNCSMHLREADVIIDGYN